MPTSPQHLAPARCTTNDSVTWSFRQFGTARLADLPPEAQTARRPSELAQNCLSDGDDEGYLGRRGDAVHRLEGHRRLPPRRADKGGHSHRRGEIAEQPADAQLVECGLSGRARQVSPIGDNEVGLPLSW